MGNCICRPATPVVELKSTGQEGRCGADHQAVLVAATCQLPRVDTTQPLHKSVLGKVKPDDVQEEYEVGTVLGVGQFGVTRLAVHKNTRHTYACKSISKANLHPSEAASIRNELRVMHHLAGHTNVVDVVDALEDHSHVHIIMELCSGGDLVQILTGRGQYTEKDAAAAIRTMLEVVAYCHDMGVVHRDLKLENFLAADQRRDPHQLKATDFGLSTFYKPGQRLSDVCGTAFYMAPEVLMKDYDEKADVWALGVILYILLCGRPPFDFIKDEDIFRAIMDDGKPDFSSYAWENVSQAARECVQQMMTWDGRQRPSARDMLQHPWVRKDGVAGEKLLEPEVLQRLKSFAEMNALKKQTLMFMAQSMSEDELQGLRELFESMDTDHSGTISLQELRQGLLSRGVAVPEQLLVKIMEMADVNHNMCLDYEEFVGATIHVCKLQREDKLLEAFKHFDCDGDGFITKEELTKALSVDSVDAAALQADVQQVLHDADTNGDGRIDYMEFVAMMVPAYRKRNSAAEFASNWLRQQQAKQQQQHLQGDCSAVRDASQKHASWIGATPSISVGMG